MVKLKLQGALAHGHGRFFYLAPPDFPSGGANLMLSTMLHTLRQLYARLGRLPPTLALQYDGGSENANKFVLGVLCLLVTMGVFDMILVSRLPVGHTHEDIDGCFGSIWKRIRGRSLQTLRDVEVNVQESFHDSLETKVFSDYAVFDYKEWIQPCLPKAFGRCFKGDDTQHRFKISRDTRGNARLFWRRFASDKVVEVLPIESKCRRVCSSWFPDADGLLYLTQRPRSMSPKKLPLNIAVYGDQQAFLRKVHAPFRAAWSEFFSGRELLDNYDHKCPIFSCVDCFTGANSRCELVADGDCSMDDIDEVCAKDPVCSKKRPGTRRMMKKRRLRI
ncbi:MAG: hypothetical protein AAFO91_20020, partial [Bacteroidota bacterium]